MNNTVMIEIPVINPATKKLAGFGVTLEYQIGKPIMESKFIGFTKSANYEWCMNTLKNIPENEAAKMAELFGMMLFNKQ